LSYSYKKRKKSVLITHQLDSRVWAHQIRYCRPTKWSIKSEWTGIRKCDSRDSNQLGPGWILARYNSL